MKKQLVLSFISISLLVLTMLSFTPIVFGATYSIDVSEGDTKEYKVIVNDNNDVGGEAGGTTTITIDNILVHHPEEGGWSITIDPGNDDPGVKLLPADPSIVPTYPGFVCALNVEDYLAACKTGWDNVEQTGNYEHEPSIQVSGTTIRLNVTDTEYDKISTDVWEVTYNSTTGWATSFKGWNQDLLVTHITELTEEGEEGEEGIPGYQMPIFLGIAALSVIALIVIKKRRI